MRIGIGLSLTRLSGGAGAWSPADIPDCDLAHLWDGATLYTTDGGTTVAAADDPVGRQVAQVGPDAVQSSSSLRPTRKADGVSLDATDDTLPLAAEVVLAGDFTVYLTGQRTAGRWVALGTSVVSGSASDFVGITDVPAVQLNHAGGPVGSTASVPAAGVPILVRFRRSSGSVLVASTGQAEQEVTTGSAHTIRLGVVGTIAGVIYRSDDPAARYRDRLIYTRDLTAEERSQVEAYFAAQGYSL